MSDKLKVRESIAPLLEGYSEKPLNELLDSLQKLKDAGYNSIMLEPNEYEMNYCAYRQETDEEYAIRLTQEKEFKKRQKLERRQNKEKILEKLQKEAAKFGLKLEKK